MSDADYEISIYGRFGWAIFIIVAGIVLILKDVFPDGTIFMSGGIIILLVTIVKKIKGIEVEMLEVVVGIGLLINGLNNVFKLDISFFPLVLVVIGLWLLATLFKEIKQSS